MPAIVDVMELADVPVESLKQIVVAHGPGSYTGVRIGITTAKTMAWGLDIPIITVSSLRALAYNALFFDGYIMPFFNARRNAVFTGLYRFEAGTLEEIIEEQYVSLDDWFHKLKALNINDGDENGKIVCLSPHIDVCKQSIDSELGDLAIIPENDAHLLRPVNLIYASESASEEQVHLVSPNYLRITEAEANLLKRRKN